MSEEMSSNTESQNSPFEVRNPAITLESDVILAPETRRLFEEAIGAMKHHKTIYSEWGFGDVDPMGRNMILNLYGPPGTGKTLAAEAFAGSLGRQFIHIGIAELESKSVKDFNRLNKLEEGNIVTQRALLALLAHGIDGNDVEAMRKAKAELTDYLIER